MSGMHPLRIEEIKYESINFPLFLTNQIDDDDHEINAAIYITGLTNLDPTGVPNNIVCNRESVNGIITQSVYQLVSSTKYNSKESKKIINSQDQ